MNFNWNVYKIFKNGKRAKAPMHQFEYRGDLTEALSFFNSTIKKNLVEKIGAKTHDQTFVVVNADQSQARICEGNDEKEKLFLMKRNRVLIMEARKRKVAVKKGYRAGLVMTRETNWKWQWAILQAATSQFKGAISDQFNTYPEAMAWINRKIDHL